MNALKIFKQIRTSLACQPLSRVTHCTWFLQIIEKNSLKEKYSSRLQDTTKKASIETTFVILQAFFFVKM